MSQSSIDLFCQPASALQGVWSLERLYKKALYDNSKLIGWCMSVGLLADSVACEIHGRQRKLKPSKTRGTLMWICEDCKGTSSHSVPVTQDSLVHEENTPMDTLLILSYCYANSLSLEDTRIACQRFSMSRAVSYREIKYWFQEFNRRLVRAMASQEGSPNVIGGFNKIVTVSTSMIEDGTIDDDQNIVAKWIVGMVSGEGEVAFATARQYEGSTIREIIQRKVIIGTTVVTNSWSGYMGLGSLNFVHQVDHVSAYEFLHRDMNPERFEHSRGFRRRVIMGESNCSHSGKILCKYLWREKCKKQQLDPWASFVQLLRAH